MHKTLFAKALTIGLLAMGYGLQTKPAEAVSLTRDGTGFTVIETVDHNGAGVYGLEARGGRSGARDWEIGVGARTSSPGNFKQGEFTWGNSATELVDFYLSWIPEVGLTTTIGGSTTSWTDSSWQVGDAIRIFTKREAILNLTEVDGQAVDYNLGDSTEGFSPVYYLTGDSLLDGWTLSGQIGVTGGGGSKHAVSIQAGNFAQTAQDVPAPAAGLPALALMGLAIARRKKQSDVSLSS
ncbi:MAG: PTPA-CTERM sorting domain-containing protein [Cyanobacteria bacterium P01_D01_bin.105]